MTFCRLRIMLLAVDKFSFDFFIAYSNDPNFSLKFNFY